MNREYVGAGLIMTPFVMLLVGLVAAGIKSVGWEITAVVAGIVVFAVACIAGGIYILEKGREKQE